MFMWVLLGNLLLLLLCQNNYVGSDQNIENTIFKRRNKMKNKKTEPNRIPALPDATRTDQQYFSWQPYNKQKESHGVK